MKKTEEISTLPENYEELKKQANRTSNWRERLDAVEELGHWKNKQIIDILMRLMNHDAVYKVQEAAYRQLKKLVKRLNYRQGKKATWLKMLLKYC